MLKNSAIILMAAAILLFGMPAFAASSSDQPSKWAKADVAAAIKAGQVPAELQSKYQISDYSRRIC
jgi:hypothetical protein